MREPAFWWDGPGALSALLSPAAWIYGAVAGSRMAGRGTRVSVPVICVGNFTLGGTGKTPTAIAIARILADAGQRPFFLTRGYGGEFPGPVQVDAETHRASEVGDEALLLAKSAPTIVSRDRVTGARAAIAGGAAVIVMDDGLQNPTLHKDLTIAVIDGTRGVGNGRVFPAGPLRAPLFAQVTRADAVLIVGTGTPDLPSNRPLLRAYITPDAAAVAAMKQRKVLAFAGIGDPQRFFATVKSAGIDAPVCKAFDDHHRFTAEEAGDLIMQAEREGLSLLTTEKDHARMNGEPLLAALAQRAHTLPVTMEFDDAPKMRELVLGAIRR